MLAIALSAINRLVQFGGDALEFSILAGIPFAAPALMAGNVGLLKHASNGAVCRQLRRLCTKRAFHRFQTLWWGADKVADLIASEQVKAATLTGVISRSSLAASAETN